MAKSNLFKGLAAVFGFTLSVCAFMSVIAFDRQGDIDNRLGVGRGNVNTQGSAYASEKNSAKRKTTMRSAPWPKVPKTKTELQLAI